MERAVQALRGPIGTPIDLADAPRGRRGAARISAWSASASTSARFPQGVLLAGGVGYLGADDGAGELRRRARRRRSTAWWGRE